MPARYAGADGPGDPTDVDQLIAPGSKASRYWSEHACF